MLKNQDHDNRAAAPKPCRCGPGLRRALPRIADSMSRGVRDRTASGRDTRGRRFAPKADGSPSTAARDTGRDGADRFGTASDAA